MQSLREHKGQCGGDVGERAEFDCSLCDASFTTKRAAMLHERSTHGVRDFCGYILGVTTNFDYFLWVISYNQLLLFVFCDEIYTTIKHDGKGT